MKTSNKTYKIFTSYFLPTIALLKCLVLLLFLSNPSYSQNNSLIFEHIGSDDGLSSNDVRAISQDYRGFLWIGTQNGLNRYDGKDIKHFYHQLNDSCSISTNWINAIYEDEEKNLWIGTRGGGLNLFVRETGKFVSWQNDHGDENSISGNDVSVIFEDSNERLWIGTSSSGLNLFDRKSGTFKRWINNPKNSNSLSHNSVSAIAEDESGRLWIGTSGAGINVFNFSTNTFTNWEDISLDRSNSPFDFISSVVSDKKGNIWIGSDNILTKVSPATGKYKKWVTTAEQNNKLSSGFIENILEDEKGNFWIATKDAGLNYFNIETEIFTSSRYSDSDFSLSHDEVLTIFKDNSNILWIGTHGGGINKLSLKNLAFRYWSTSHRLTNGLPEKEVRRLFLDKNDIVWIGTNNGLSKFDRNENTFTNYNVIPHKNSGSKRNRIRSIYRSKKGVLYVGVEKGGLNEFDEKHDKFISYLPMSGAIEKQSSRNMRAICEDSDGILWLGTYNGGLHSFNPKTKELKWVPINSEEPLASKYEQIEVMLNHDKDEIWLGTQNGLILFNTKTYQSKKWIQEDGNSNSLVYNAIRSLYEDDKGILWIGTRGGLSRFNLKNIKFKNFTVDDGLPSELIYGIVPVSKDEIWLATANGLSKFNKDKYVFTNLSVPYNNQLDVAINSPSNPTEIIMGGKNGLTIFNSEEIVKNTRTPEVVFTEFRKYNVPIEMNKDYPEASSLNLDHTENMFSISFASLDFSNPTSNQYSYKLEGFNSDWIDLQNNNTVTFTNLDPGNYSLLVKASNNDGYWNPNPTVLDINIEPPFWKTIYFQVALVLFLILLAFAGIKWKIRSVETQNKTLDKLVKLRTSELESEIDERKKIEVILQDLNVSKDKFFSIISHDLRSPFTAITGLTTYLLAEFITLSNEEIREYISTIDKSSKRVYGLLENLLDWSRIQTGRMIFKPEIFSVNSIINEVIKLFEINFKNKNICIEFENSKGSLVFADYEMVYTILRNIVSNAIKFTPENGLIKIILKNEPEAILISIIDNGVGMNEEALTKLFRIDVQYTTSGTRKEKGSGLGLILCKELVETNKGKIWVESNEETGTVFNFTLPSNI